MKKVLLLALIIAQIYFALSCSLEQVNINTASKEDLMKITYIKDARADEIISLRVSELFNSLDDLLKVKGIGNITLEKIKQQRLACVENESKDLVIDEEVEIIDEVNNKTEKENPIINKQETKPEVVVNDKPNTQEILILNSPEEVIYKSKNTLIQEYAIYGFCIFLIFIIIVLIIKM